MKTVDTHPEELPLVLAAKSGDQDAWRALWQLRAPWRHQTARAWSSLPSDLVEDVISNSFTYAVESYDPAGGRKWNSWLFMVTRQRMQHLRISVVARQWGLCDSLDAPLRPDSDAQLSDVLAAPEPVVEDHEAFWKSFFSPGEDSPAARAWVEKVMTAVSTGVYWMRQPTNPVNPDDRRSAYTRLRQRVRMTRANRKSRKNLPHSSQAGVDIFDIPYKKTGKPRKNCE